MLQKSERNCTEVRTATQRENSITVMDGVKSGKGGREGDRGGRRVGTREW